MKGEAHDDTLTSRPDATRRKRRGMVSAGEQSQLEPGSYLAALRDVLARTYPHWGCKTLAVAGAGLNFLVCRAETARYGTLALRTPWVATLVNDTDGVLDARRLLRQEAALTDYVRARHPGPGDPCTASGR